MNFEVWKFFPSKENYAKEPLHHLRSIFFSGYKITGPVSFEGSCTVWPRVDVSSQFAGFPWLLFSIENVEAGLVWLAPFSFERAGIAIDAPGMEISTFFMVSLWSSYNNTLGFGRCLTVSLGILWYRLAWNRITNLCWCKMVKWSLITFGNLETLENRGPLETSCSSVPYWKCCTWMLFVKIMWLHSHKPVKFPSLKRSFW